MKEEKIRKFTIKQTDRQTLNISKTEPTLILCGYSGERAIVIPRMVENNYENLHNDMLD